MTIDKYKHIVLSAIIAVALNLFLPWWVAGIGTLAIGVGKELYDMKQNGNHWCWKDILADAVGVVIRQHYILA